MKTPQVHAMPGMAPLGFPDSDENLMRRCLLNPLSFDQAEIARRKAAAPLLASKPQQAADFGLFGDSAAQTDLVDMSRRAKR